HSTPHKSARRPERGLSASRRIYTPWQTSLQDERPSPSTGLLTPTLPATAFDQGPCAPRRASPSGKGKDVTSIARPGGFGVGGAVHRPATAWLFHRSPPGGFGGEPTHDNPPRHRAAPPAGAPGGRRGRGAVAGAAPRPAGAHGRRAPGPPAGRPRRRLRRGP